MTWTNGASRTSTTAHKHWRAAVLKRDTMCQIRGRLCTGRATEADHIVNIRAGGAPLDVDNGQGVCGPCHRDKTAMEAAKGRWPESRRHPVEQHPWGGTRN